MENLKEIRWKQRFENFDKSYKLLKKYSHKPIVTELERKSPRETVKQAFQIGLIDNGHVWIDALSNRNLTTHTYDEELAIKMTSEILDAYLPELDKMYEKLSKEL